MWNAARVAAAIVVAYLLAYWPAALISHRFFADVSLEGNLAGLWAELILSLPDFLNAVVFGAICGRLVETRRRGPWTIAIAVLSLLLFVPTMINIAPELQPVSSMVATALLGGLTFALSALTRRPLASALPA